MKTICQKRSTPARPSARGSVKEQLETIQQSLNEMNAELRRISEAKGQFSARPSTDYTRYLSEPDAAKFTLASSSLADHEDTIAFCNRHFRSLIEQALQEEIHILTLNGNHRVIRSHQITVGLLSSAPLHPREVFRPAILDAAAAIMLVHNHPSGNCVPSDQDLKATRDVEAAAKVVGIPLLDHIILARDRSISIFQWRDERRPLIG